MSLKTLDISGGWIKVLRKVLVVIIAFTTITNVTPVIAGSSIIPSNTKVFEIKIGASRLIYNPDSNGSVLTVSNNQKFPILVQGKIYDVDKKSKTRFLVTPPISRLDPHQQSRLRIINAGEEFPQDRESLKWLCIAGIPPKNTDLWMQGNGNYKRLSGDDATINLEVSARQCIKILVRPSNLSGSMLDAANDVTWEVRAKEVVAHNSSPFYINLSSISVGDNHLDEVSFIPPFSSKSFPLSEMNHGVIKWRVITDQGGVSKVFSSDKD